MTAESAESKGPMREPEQGGPKVPVPPIPARCRGRRLRRRPPAQPPLKGQLRMRSPAGAFVMVGVSVVLVGMTIAVVGYWPHRGHGGTSTSAENTSVGGDMRREVAAGRHVPHSEKLKLIGPVIMGIGLFIFICANTMLYENRDMETRQLMQKGLYGLTAGLPEEPRPEDGHCQHGDSQPFPKASAECVEGCYQVDLSCQPCPSSKGPAEHLPKAPEVSQAPLSASSSTAPCGQDSTGDAAAGGGSDHVVISIDGGCPGTEPLVEFSPNVPLHIPGHSKSLDLGRPGVLLLAPVKDRRNRSWPRLDPISLVGYAKLESAGESSDRL
ncbi:T200B protein, partial [Spelaeornis formosus]|nr:T200B protein [Elachura formosa]